MTPSPGANGTAAASKVQSSSSVKNVASSGKKKKPTAAAGTEASPATKGKKATLLAGKAAIKNDKSVTADKSRELNYTPIVQGRASSLPVVFTKDYDYFCVASSSSVKIHSRTTGEVVSTLSSSLDTSQGAGQKTARSVAHIDTITGMMIHPHNPLQMITASLDGTVKVWDYLDAVLLKNIDVGLPITHLTAHPTIKDSLFVAVRKPKTNTASGQKPDPYSFSGRTNSIIYSVSFAVTGGRSTGAGITPRKPKELLRLGKTKEASGLQVSPDGKWLVAIGNRKVQIASISSVRQGFTKFVSDERLVCLAFHPSQPIFATGDAAGKIRIWYCLDEKYISQSRQAGAEKHAPSTLLHWHAHAVATLAFTPNGAHLLSGGEEAVLVLWQLNSKAKEFVPRLGAPINSISIADGTDGREQEFVLGMADGSVTFVGALNLKVTRSFARVKIDPLRHLLPASRLSTIPSPLAVEPCTGEIVLTSGHPSSLQFFDVANDRITWELEVSPSNRVSRPEATPLEPTRIEKVVFSCLPVGGAGSGPAEWMATLDSRRGGGNLASELALKFWRYSSSTARYVLNTRIDKPHGEGITSMSFSPLNRSDDPSSLLFVTTGLDKKIKTWRIASHAARGGRLETYWVPRSVFGYRDTIPMKAAWSPDGSLLAVAQGAFLTLWEPISNSLSTALSCPELKSAREAEFVGRGGRYVVLSSGRTMVLWDLVQGSVRWHKTFDGPIEKIVVVDDGNGWAVLRQSAAEGGRGGKMGTTVEVFQPLSSEPVSSHRMANVRIREATATSPSSAIKRHVPGSWGLEQGSSPRFLAVTDSFEVLNVGLTEAKEPLAGPSSSSSSKGTPQSLRSVRIKRRTLFDDLFGSTDDAFEEEQLHRRTRTLAEGPSPRGGGGGSSQEKGKNGKELFALFDAPPHLLPPVKMLFDSFVEMVLPPCRTGTVEEGGKEVAEADGDADGGGEEEEAERKSPSGAPQDETKRPHTHAQTTQEEEEEMTFLIDLFSRQLSTRHQKEREHVMTSVSGGEGGDSKSKKQGKASRKSVVRTDASPRERERERATVASDGQKSVASSSSSPRLSSTTTGGVDTSSSSGSSGSRVVSTSLASIGKKRKSLN